jgi:D-alanyl-D-alanine carboxypeptidase
VHGDNARARLSPASLTKIVTALVATERVDLAQTVYVTVDGGALSASTNATIMGLQPGQSLGMVDLLYGMLLPSGNDAAIEIAEYIAGSVDEFSVLMNAKVEELGLEDTHFANPHGLDEPGHYTSAYDIAILGSQLLDDPDLAAIVGTRSYQPHWDGPPVRNLNLLLGQYPGALGVKTGYTEQAGQTLVAAAERAGRRFIVSVLGSTDVFVDGTALLDWAFASAPDVCGPPGGSQVSAGG